MPRLAYSSAPRFDCACAGVWLLLPPICSDSLFRRPRKIGTKEETNSSKYCAAHSGSRINIVANPDFFFFARQTSAAGGTQVTVNYLLIWAGGAAEIEAKPSNQIAGRAGIIGSWAVPAFLGFLQP